MKGEKAMKKKILDIIGFVGSVSSILSLIIYFVNR
nr:MAG TPA: hypothetical protein [Caudoviricetes sp.]DAV35762.1 MAG TPA: hypothetical protein [Caudoviricetes sp.]